MKPEDWANLQVGAWAALHRVRSGSASDRRGPGPLAHSRLLTRTRAHARAHTVGHADEPIHAGPFPSLRSLPRLIRHARLLSCSFPGALAACASSHTHTRSIHTHGGVSLQTPHSHMLSHTHKSPFVHSHKPFHRVLPHSHTCLLVAQTRSHTHIRPVHILVLLHTYSHIYSPAQVNTCIPDTRLLSRACLCVHTPILTITLGHSRMSVHVPPICTVV